MADTSSLSDEILAAIKYAIERETSSLKYDRTYRTVVVGVQGGGKYTVRDESGQNRTVKCSLPDYSPVVGTYVWVTVPCNSLKDSIITGAA